MSDFYLLHELACLFRAIFFRSSRIFKVQSVYIVYRLVASGAIVRRCLCDDDVTFRPPTLSL